MARTTQSSLTWCLVCVLAIVSCESEAPGTPEVTRPVDAKNASPESSVGAEDDIRGTAWCKLQDDCIPPTRCVSGCFTKVCATPCRSDWDCPPGEECNCKGPGCRSWGSGLPFNYCWQIHEDNRPWY